MGIPKLFGHWVKPLIKEIWGKNSEGNPMLNYIPADIDTLVIDMNGTIHQAFRKYYYDNNIEENVSIEKIIEKGSFNSEKIFNKICLNCREYLMEIIRNINPKTTLMISVDGVTGKGKMKQQKQRRYKFVGKYEKGTPDNSCAVTTGTKFMEKLHDYLKSYLSRDGIRHSFPKNVIYSSYLVPGEGEHKIMEFIRNPYNTKDNSKIDIGNLAIYGLDCDLLMLGILLPLKPNENVYLVRENLEEKASFSISDFKEGLKKFIDYFKTKLKLEYNILEEINDGKIKETVSQDFVVLCMLLGNDFLPHPHFYDSTKEFMNEIFTIYVKNNVSLTYENENYNKNNIITPKYYINFSNFYKLLKSLKNTDIDLIEKEYKNNKRKFPDYEDEFLNDCISDGNLNNTLFSKKWYLNDYEKFKLTNPNNEIYNETYYEMEHINYLCEKYVQVMDWVFCYYQTAYTNQEIYYPYSHCPTLKDLTLYLCANFKNNNDNDNMDLEDETSKFYNSIHNDNSYELPFYVNHDVLDQMFCVLPPSAIKFHINDNIKKIIKESRLLEIIGDYFCIEEKEGITENNNFLSTIIVKSVDNIEEIKEEIDKFRYYNSKSKNKYNSQFKSYEKEEIYIVSNFEKEMQSDDFLRNYNIRKQKKEQEINKLTKKYNNDFNICRDFQDLSLSNIKKIKRPTQQRQVNQDNENIEDNDQMIRKDEGNDFLNLNNQSNENNEDNKKYILPVSYRKSFKEN